MSVRKLRTVCCLFILKFLWLNYLRVCVGVYHCQMLLLKGDFSQGKLQLGGTSIGVSESNEVLFVPVFPLPLDQTSSLFRSVLNMILKATTKRSRGFTLCAPCPVLTSFPKRLCPGRFSTQGCCRGVVSEPRWAARQVPRAEGFAWTILEKLRGAMAVCHQPLPAPWSR